MDKNLAKPEMNGMENEREVLDDDFSDSSYDIAYNTMSMLFFDQEHISGLMQAVQRSQDPAKVVGTAVGQIAILAYNKLNQADLGIDDRVWAAEGGVLDSALEEADEYFREAGVELNPETLVQSTLQVIQESPLANPAAEAQGQPAPAQGGAPNNMAAPQGAMA